VYHEGQQIISRFVSSFGKGHLHFIGIGSRYGAGQWPNAVGITKPGDLLDYMRTTVRKVVAREAVRF